MRTEQGHGPRPRTPRIVGVRAVLATLAMVVLAVVVTAAPAQADPSGHLNDLVSGPFTGTASVTSDPDCPFVSVTQHHAYGEGRPPPASGTVDVETCVDDRSAPFSVTGTFTFTTRTGAVLFGTLAGSANFVGSEIEFQHTYTVTGGTRQFRHVHGTITSTGAVVDLSVGTIVGTHTAALQKG